MPIHAELCLLYQKDLQDRKKYENQELSLQRLKKNDEQRLNRLRNLVGTFDENEIWNCHYACLLFLHSWNNTEDYKLAHKYAKKAVTMGSRVTKWLYAASKDRMLVAQGKNNGSALNSNK